MAASPTVISFVAVIIRGSILLDDARWENDRAADDYVSNEFGGDDWIEVVIASGSRVRMAVGRDAYAPGRGNVGWWNCRNRRVEDLCDTGVLRFGSGALSPLGAREVECHAIHRSTKGGWLPINRASCSYAVQAEAAEKRSK